MMGLDQGSLATEKIGCHNTSSGIQSRLRKHSIASPAVDKSFI